MSLGSILSVAAPIAAGYFTGGAGGTSLFGLEATGSAIAAGALTGAGIAALSGGDILTSAAMGGLGGYGGGELGAAFNPAGASGIASATGTTNAAVNQAAMSNMTGSALGQGGFNTAAGRGLMGVATPGMAGAAGAGANTGLQNVTAGNTGQGFSPYATPDTLGESVTQFSTDAAYNAANPNLGIDVSDVVRDRITGQVAGPNLGTGTDPSNFFGDASSYTGAQTPDFANIVKSTPQELAANQARQAVDTSFSAGLERLGDGSKGKGAMKLGLAGLPVLAAAYEPETFTYDQMKEAEAYDPDATLNLDDPALDSGIEDVINEDSGLRLYAKEGGMIPSYAEGGTIESRAAQGMKDALARNQGTAYAQPTTTAPSNNIRIAGADNSTSNIRGGVGSLNVNSGSIGQSANAVAETARLKAIEDAKPKTRTMLGAYGTQMTVPIDYDPGVNSVFGGRKPSHYQLKDGTWVKGTPPTANYFNNDRTNAYGYVNRFAEGGTVESRADQGMRDALARNQGTAYTQPTTTASNVNTGSTLNINRGMGSLNVNSGTVGQSANAIAEAARLKAIEDAKPKIETSLFSTYPNSFIQKELPRMNNSFLPIDPGIQKDPVSGALVGQFGRGYAEGGTIESRADQGMRDALARNQGTSYAQPTTAYTPTTAPSNNINIAGADNSTSNLTGGVGSLNVNSGTVGQSANARAEAVRLKAIEDAKPKSFSGQNVGGSSNTPFSVPTKFVMGQGTMPADYQGGLLSNYYTDIAGNYIRRAEGGPIPAAYAEGGMLEGPGDGMSDSLAAQIDGSQPAALSQGEFVVPADVVSHLGNGSSDAGSKRLYAMMDEVRKARTGTEKQGKEINPERYMPA